MTYKVLMLKAPWRFESSLYSFLIENHTVMCGFLVYGRLWRSAHKWLVPYSIKIRHILVKKRGEWYQFPMQSVDIYPPLDLMVK